MNNNGDFLIQRHFLPILDVVRHGILDHLHMQSCFVVSYAISCDSRFSILVRNLSVTRSFVLSQHSALSGTMAGRFGRQTMVWIEVDVLAERKYC